MAGAVKILPHYTYNDWVNWEGKWELIEGIPYAMSPLPDPRHQKIAVAISATFYFALKNCTSCTVFNPLDYKIADDIILQPDMLIVCGNISGRFLDFPPALIVEILSPSTALKDRHSKYQLYQDQQIPYYLIVAPDTEEVEVFVLVDKIYQLQQKGRECTFEFIFDGGCTAHIDFKEIW